MKPADEFIEGLRRLGFEPAVDSQLVIYEIEPVEGARAGKPVRTAVAVDDLVRWPQMPPHWIHLPNDVKLWRTNTRPSVRQGWTMHSRKTGTWGHDRNPVSAWVSHVRGILGEVIG